MWYLLGTMIGAAWDIQEREKDSPEVKAERAEKARNGLIFLACFFLLLLVLCVLAAFGS